jgi:quercetin dioxygenase-like cupin family protein
MALDPPVCSLHALRECCLPELLVHQERVFDSAAFFQTGEVEPPRIVITQSTEAAVVCWHVEPGQRIELHVHPSGQDTWVVLSGHGLYFLDQSSAPVALHPGIVAVAPAGAVHGAVNTGSTPLRFVSVVSPALSGFEPVSPSHPSPA